MPYYKTLSNLNLFIILLNKENITNRVMVLFYCLLQSALTLLQHKNHKIIWLIGENAGDCLQDNGYYFYRYCREQHPRDNTFFLINKSSPFYNELRKDNHVILYGSFRHIELFFSANILFYTHNFKDILYKKLFNFFRKNQKLVYLHHGVLGFKKFDKFYSKNKNAMNIFTVGSELEKDILITQEGVYQEKIKTTGYARYDYLKNKVHAKEIVYIPTHRSMTTADIKNTDFYLKTQSLLNNTELNEFLKQQDITLHFYLHQAMCSFLDDFHCTSPNIKIIKYGEYTPLQLIKRCNLMITDYSSVSWDFFYLGKPVIFYRFDINNYLNDRDSYIDLNKNFIGDVVLDEDQVVRLIKQYSCKYFKENKLYSEYRKKIMPKIDHNNCQRIYDEACKLNNLYQFNKNPSH